MKPKIRLYLDGRRIGADGLCPICFKITYRSTTAMAVSDIRIKREEWNAESQTIIKHPNKTAYNRYFANKLEELCSKIDNLIMEDKIDKESVASEIKELLFKQDYKRKIYFWDVLNEYKNKMGTSSKRMFQSTADRIAEYDKLHKRRTMEDITSHWLEGFEEFLKNKRKNSHNTIVNHMQHIRTAVNYAIKEELTSFSGFRKFHSLTAKPTKRSLKIEDLRHILLMEDFKHQQYLDMFKLSFYLIGMNMVDIIHLPYDAIVDGRIGYVRQKLKRNGKELSIRVEPEAMAIINKYRGKEHLLRWMEDELCKKKYIEHPEKIPEAYGAIIRRCDNLLKQVKKGLTTYYARHSWATIARNHCKIDIDDIAQALGHSSAHKTTNIYLTLANEVVDEANRKVIDFVLNGKWCFDKCQKDASYLNSPF